MSQFICRKILEKIEQRKGTAQSNNCSGQVENWRGT